MLFHIVKLSVFAAFVAASLIHGALTKAVATETAPAAVVELSAK